MKGFKLRKRRKGGNDDAAKTADASAHLARRLWVYGPDEIPLRTGAPARLNSPDRQSILEGSFMTTIA